MFRNMSGEGHFSGGQSPSSPTGHGVAAPGLDNQENSWISLLSVVSRPALSFLQKYLPGRPRNSALSDNVAGWVSRDLKHNFVDEERAFLGQLDDMLPLTQHPAPRLAYLGCQHDGAAGLMEPRSGSTLHWLTTDSLREIGIQDADEVDVTISQQTQIGYFSTARSFFSHVLVSPASTQEMKHAGAGKDWPTEAASSPVKSVGRTWWGGFWASEESSQSLSSNLSWGKEGTVTGQHCPQQPAAGTKATVAKTTELFVQSSSRESMPGENAGQSGHKEEPADNGGLQTAQPESLQRSDGSTPDHQPVISISSHLISSGAATACSEVALLTPDQDNGYSSLEEEHSHICHLFMVKAHCEGEPQQVAESKGGRATMKVETEGELSEEGDSTPVKGMEVEERQEVMEGSDVSSSEDEGEEETPTQEGPSVAATVVTTPQCQNKAIAYIMGSPCSDEDDDDSQSDGESSEDDDGFDSEGSSELSDSGDEDDDDSEGSDSDNEADSETERLWSSLCQSRDPYNPRNFTARLHTSTAPRTIPAAASASPQSTPASSPDQAPSPLSCSPASPPQSYDTWDDSTSASEVDEAESLRLWTSFSSSSDPYSPFNFQAPLRTRAPAEAGPGARARGRGKKTSPRHTAAVSPPQYRKEEAEERLDSGFSEPLASTVASSTTSTTLGCVTVKKVRFCEEVEEFFASCGEEEEDRRGPWEELARDRCRFLRRCQEVEQSIAYCLQPRHRNLVYQSRTVWYSQEA
ncbi:protein phosphatase 1 regulatory subunit 15B-like [Centroberyx affinis]|uniref:protein phosphatase 1 regulatory subunit 15B-like n=1 Tax=Centroberyx affinis TaxID=166261 RepID=UPI003A5C6996